MKIIWTLVTIVSLIALIYGIWQWIRSARAGQNSRTAKIITAIATVLFFISIKSIIGTLIAVAGMLALVSGIWSLFRKRTAGGSLLLIIMGIVLAMAGTTLVGPSSTLREDAARSTQTSAEAKSSAAEEESSAKAEYESLTAKESSSRAESAESSSLEKAAAESSAAANSSVAQAEQAAASLSQAAAVVPQNTNDQQLVYITATGSKYHFNRGCRGLRNANSVSTMSLSDATAQGLTVSGR
ncbi:hypothetical protein [Schleiferilactobacillus harbinensis]|uniref:hypothetical protein n=1 Tax=Schleiferilactobacillus harbinensis TaxID=304207 RepID=UPI0007B9EF6E|nr:hypothetical protein [Schleiferilactobacillus harbinensis]